jgi:putative hydroxymethylpyrimidine transport system substrate-binding protein
MRKPLIALKPLTGLCLAMLGALGLAACGERTEAITPTTSKSLSLMLDYFPNADHVGIYDAAAKGYFKAAGLNVLIEPPSNASSPLQLLEAGKVDLAISYEPDLMLARDKGEPLVAIAALVQQPLTAIVSVGTKHITAVAALRGKTVGTSGIPYQHAYLDTILGQAGVPAASVKEVNVGFNLVPAMLSGKVDATLGAYWNYEAIQLAQQHKNPNVIRMPSVGLPNYDELVIVAKRDVLSTDADQLRAFLYALSRGYADARSDPAAAVQTLTSAVPGLDPRLQLASVRATAASYFPTGAPWGWQNQTQWNAFGRWMIKNHLISNAAAVADASTNELLAGQGEPGAQAGTGLS